MADIKYNIIKTPEDNSEETDKNKYYGELLHQWSYKEFDEVHRGKIWYIVLGIFLITMCIYCIKTDNLLFMIIVIMSCLFIVMSKSKKPGYIYFSIYETGIEIDKKTFYPWDRLNDFCIIYDAQRDVKKLYFTTNGAVQSLIRVNLESDTPVEITDTLKLYLNENLDRKYEHLSDRIEKTFKL